MREQEKHSCEEMWYGMTPCLTLVNQWVKERNKTRQGYRKYIQQNVKLKGKEKYDGARRGNSMNYYKSVIVLKAKVLKLWLYSLIAKEMLQSCVGMKLYILFYPYISIYGVIHLVKTLYIVRIWAYFTFMYFEFDTDSPFLPKLDSKIYGMF